MGRIPCYRLGIPHRFATTLYKGAVAGVRESALMSFPTRVTMNTPATSPCYCVSRQKRDALCVLIHRFCAYGAFPAELRTSPNSADFPEQPRSEKGGETMIHSQVTTRVQMGDGSAPDGVVSEDTINGLPSDCQSYETDDDEGNQGLTQRSGSEGNELQEAITDVTPVALRTRRRQQHAAQTRIDGCEGDLRQDTNRNESEDKELIRRLTTQNEEQQHMIDEFSSGIKDFLKVQSIVKKTDRDLAKITRQVEYPGKFKVTVSKIVKPFTPANNSNGVARDQESMNHDGK